MVITLYLFFKRNLDIIIIPDTHIPLLISFLFYSHYIPIKIMSEPFTKEPPHVVAANAGQHVAALSMAPLPPGASSHADAAVKHLAEAAKNQSNANSMKSGGSKKVKKTKRKSKKNTTARISRSRSRTRSRKNKTSSKRKRASRKTRSAKSKSRGRKTSKK